MPAAAACGAACEKTGMCSQHERRVTSWHSTSQRHCCVPGHRLEAATCVPLTVVLPSNTQPADQGLAIQELIRCVLQQHGSQRGLVSEAPVLVEVADTAKSHYHSVLAAGASERTQLGGGSLQQLVNTGAGCCAQCRRPPTLTAGGVAVPFPHSSTLRGDHDAEQGSQVLKWAAQLEALKALGPALTHVTIVRPALDATAASA
jgi:hypothetical protein